MVDAGVRAELLLGRLEGYMALSDGDDEEEEAEEEEQIEEQRVAEEGENDVEDTTTTGNGHDRIGEIIDVVKKDVNSEDYLKSELQYDGDKIVDSDQYGLPPPLIPSISHHLHHLHHHHHHHRHTLQGFEKH